MNKFWWYGSIIFLLCSPHRAVSQEVQTHAVKLKYDIYLENLLTGLGLIDMTKLPEQLKEEVEEMEIVRYAKIPDLSINGQIVILDANKNGKFEYDSIDLVGLTSFNQDMRLEAVNFTKSKTPIVVNINFKNYELQLHNDGEKIELIKTHESKYDLTFPYLLPTSDFKPLTKNASLNKENNKYTYVEFWGTWCKPCLEIVPEIKLLKEDFADQLNIVGVNYLDQDIDRVKRVILEKKMIWDHVLANTELMEVFGNPGFFPCGILFDPNGRLVQYGIHPDEVRSILVEE